MEIRRLVKSGVASHTISLPKTWLEKNKMSKGDLLYIKEKSDNELLITPNPKEEEKTNKEITINVDSKDLATIQREITSAYINNYNTIMILGSDMGTRVKDIRRILHDFVALEISELTGSKIVARDLLNLQEISIEKTIRRMDMIIRSILQDSVESIEGKNMYESVYFRDFDVNKLYFLMYRILKSSLNDSRVAESFKTTNAQAMSHWYIAMNLENIADNGKNICKILPELDKKVDKKELTAVYKEVENAYLTVMKAYFNNDRKLADSVNLSREQIIEKCDKFFEKNKKVSVFQAMSGMKELFSHICNIARLVIDAE